MGGFRERGSLYEPRNRLEMSLRVYIMLRRLTQLQKVADNESFGAEAPQTCSEIFKSRTRPETRFGPISGYPGRILVTLHLEVEQAAPTTSRGRVSGA